MALVGYARVSTEDQATRRQLDELRAAGCRDVAEEHASGGDRDRPVLARTLARLRPGDTLVVVSLDRLARSLSHLLEVIEGLQARGVHFRSLRDPVDTASPQGLFTLQVLGAAAQLERALIRERTRSGMRAAAARGRRAGNPGLRAGDPAAIHQVTAARRAAWLEGLAAGADAWLPAVQRLRAEGRPWVIT
ncbi:recombinase family protein, partial [Paracraurococcus lichenis]